MIRKFKIYVAGPLSAPDMFYNVRNAIIAADDLKKLGWYPFVPHLYSFWHLVRPHSYEEWMEMDFHWLAACDALVRLDGESPGSDREVAFAMGLGIPIFRGISSVPSIDVFEKSLS